MLIDPFAVIKHTIGLGLLILLTPVALLAVAVTLAYWIYRGIVWGIAQHQRAQRGAHV